MPRLPAKIINCVFYLYPDRESALTGRDFGGTGFLVSMARKDGSLFVYGVSNHHVAVRDGCSVIRLNTLDGDVDVIELGPEDWNFIPQGDDVAITRALELQYHHQFASARREMFEAPENKKDWRSSQYKHRIGVGDDVVMLGRFVDHDGGATNLPAARFGNISVMPTPVKQKNGALRDTYLIDMHSRSGYSGSPVFVYRTPGNDFEVVGSFVRPTPEQALAKWFDNTFFTLLGIHYGQFAEEWEGGRIIRQGADAVETEQLASVEGLSGMTLVAPADSVIALLDLPELEAERNDGTAHIYTPALNAIRPA
jgi:hypothetical protein